MHPPRPRQTQTLRTIQLLLEKVQSHYWMGLWKMLLWDLTSSDDIFNEKIKKLKLIILMNISVYSQY